MGVMIKATGDLKLNDSSVINQYVIHAVAE